MKKPTRRDVLRTGSGLAVGSLFATTKPAPAENPPKKRSRVVLIRSKTVVGDDGQVDGAELHTMLNQAVTTVLEVPDAAAAWRKLIRPADVVGIKSNVWSHLATPPALEQAMREEVLSAGVAPGNISVDDRGVLQNPIFTKATAFINVRPMRTHHWSGLGTCLKNVIMFVPRPSEYHADACATLGALWKLPVLEGKVRLNVLVMLTPQFHSVGPHSFSKRFVWTYGGLLVAVDPAPVDAVGARIIQAKRTEFFGENKPIAPSPHHIQIAGERYGLGATDEAHIELIRLGWKEESLI